MANPSIALVVLVALSGRRPNGFLGLSLNDRTILFQVILLDKSVSVGYNSLSRIRQSQSNKKSLHWDARLSTYPARR